MKIRSDFVSNSSSSSFIVDINGHSDILKGMIEAFRLTNKVSFVAKDENAKKEFEKLFKNYSWCEDSYKVNTIEINFRDYLNHPEPEVLSKIIDISKPEIIVDVGNDYDDMSGFYQFGHWLESHGFIVKEDEDSSLPYESIKSLDDEYLKN